MFAIIKTGGKQYLVEPGQTITVETLGTPVGEPVTFETLLIADDNGAVEIGKPVVVGKTVKGKVLEHGRAKKVHVIKFKSKVRYRRKAGHRQDFTRVKVEAIG